MNEFERTIQAYLDDLAQRDQVFGKKYTTSKKTIADCCKYIVSEVNKTHRSAFTDPEIYGMAIHFFDEDSVKAPDSVPGCRVVVSRPSGSVVEFSEEEKQRMKQEAQERFIEQEVRGMRVRKMEADKARKARSADKPEEKQGELF